LDLEFDGAAAVGLVVGGGTASGGRGRMSGCVDVSGGEGEGVAQRKEAPQRGRRSRV
jgi:hypothetical protein